MRKSGEKDNAEDAKKSREEHGDFVIRGGNHKWNLRRYSASRYARCGTSKAPVVLQNDESRQLASDGKGFGHMGLFDAQIAVANVENVVAVDEADLRKANAER